MASAHEQLSEQFYQWESRGRGWQVFDEPVYPEPPFEPFVRHYVPDTPIIDDGRKPTFLSSLFRKISQRPIPPVIPEAQEEEKPEPQILVRDSLIEIQTSLPADLDITCEAFEQFLLNLSRCREPIGFELLGVPESVVMQFAAHPDDAPLVRRQLQTHFPEAMFRTRNDTLETAWEGCEGDDALVVEFGLEREFMFPLETGKLDPFVGIVGALSELQPGELGLFQVLFQLVQAPWAESIIRSVTHADGKPFFVNEPELTRAAENKVGRPLYAAVVRILIRSSSFDRSLELARDLAGSLGVFANPQGNELIPLSNTGYPIEEHVEDALRRQSRRSGMILNIDELIGFVHLPASAVRSPVFKRQSGRTKAAPAIVRENGGVVLGNNIHADESCPVGLTSEQRVQHMHVIGVQGTGKSTLLFNLIRQDIENGEGVGVLDPHGDLIDQILGIIPPERINDVVLVDPSDEEYSVGFNILSAHSDLERTLLASDLVSVFQRLSTSWGDQMASVLKNAILAFLESSQGGTLADLRRFLLEPQFREAFLKTVTDPEIVYYWRKGFSQLSGNKSIGPVITRLNDFLATKPIRYMVSQPVNRLDFGQIIDTGKIFLARLSQGEMGDKDSYLLGSFFVGKIQQLVMARQAQKASVRKDFWLYIDEFHNFITPSMAKILAGARKYRLGLVLAHQELGQLHADRDVSSALLSNPYTRVYFRVGDSDARQLENALSYFESRDLQNLAKGTAICRVEKADWDFNLSVPFPEAVDPAQAEAIRQSVIAASRAQCGTLRSELQAAETASLSRDDAQNVKPKAARQPSPKPTEAKVAQVPLESIPKTEIPPRPKEETSPATSKASQTRELGRGGHQHVAIQRRIRDTAQALGFLSKLEKDVLDGKRSIDVYLEGGTEIIACEIALFNTVDWEVGRILDCVKGGLPNLFIVGVSKAHLQKIKEGVAGCLGPEGASKVGYFQPDDFIAYLKALPPPPLPANSQAKSILGYTVTLSYADDSPEEEARKDKIRISAMAEAIQENIKKKRKRRSK